jgi:hypothetical protein
MEHMTAVRAKEGVKDGDKYHNYDCGSHERRDFFDCEKMILVLFGREQFRKKLTRAMEDRAKRNENTEEPKQRRKKNKPKPAGWIGKVRKDGNWIK